MASTTPPTRASRARGVVIQVVKLSVVALLLYALARNGLLSFEQTARALNHPLELGVGLALILVTALLAAYRWHGLLRAQDIVLPLWRTVELAMVGIFFNIALPGAVTGDLVKGYYLTREAPGREARAAGTILLDRILGVGALALVCAGAQLMIPAEELTGARAALRVFVLVLAACVVAGVGYLLAVPERADILLKVMDAVTARVPKLGTLREFYMGMRHYHQTPGAFLWGLFISVLNHLVVGYAFFMFTRALEEPLTALQVYATAPPGILVTTVPVGPVGVGTGHAAFAYLFRMVGSQRGADVYTLVVLGQLMVGALGGLVYLRFKRADPAVFLQQQGGQG